MEISTYWMSNLQDLIDKGCSFTFKIKLPNETTVGKDELTDLQEIKNTIGIATVEIEKSYNP